jgi:hypothetical protein
MTHPDHAEHQAWLKQNEAEERKATLPALPPPRRKANVKFVTEASLLDTLHGLGEQVATFVSPLEARIKELESRPAFDYTGTYRAGRAYSKGQGCTQQGSIFVAMRDHPGVPATPNSGWVLACKRGRDGKDGAAK